MLAMQEFEHRGVEPGKRLILHGYEPEVTDGGRCDRCEALLRHHGAYCVSHGGERATHRLCVACHSALRSQWGNRYGSEIEV